MGSYSNNETLPLFGNEKARKIKNALDSHSIAKDKQIINYALFLVPRRGILIDIHLTKL